MLINKQSNIHQVLTDLGYTYALHPGTANLYRGNTEIRIASSHIWQWLLATNQVAYEKGIEARKDLKYIFSETVTKEKDTEIIEIEVEIKQVAEEVEEEVEEVEVKQEVGVTNYKSIVWVSYARGTIYETTILRDGKRLNYGLRGCITRTEDEQQQLRIYRDYAIGCGDMHDVLHTTIYKSVIDAKKAFYSFYCNYNPMKVETAEETTETITETAEETTETIETIETIKTIEETIEDISSIFDIDSIDQQLYADPEISLDNMVGEDIIDQQLYADNINPTLKIRQSENSFEARWKVDNIPCWFELEITENKKGKGYYLLIGSSPRMSDKIKDQKNKADLEYVQKHETLRSAKISFDGNIKCFKERLDYYTS